MTNIAMVYSFTTGFYDAVHTHQFDWTWETVEGTLSSCLHIMQLQSLFINTIMGQPTHSILCPPMDSDYHALYCTSEISILNICVSALAQVLTHYLSCLVIRQEQHTLIVSKNIPGCTRWPWRCNTKHV